MYVCMYDKNGRHVLVHLRWMRNKKVFKIGKEGKLIGPSQAGGDLFDTAVGTATDQEKKNELWFLFLLWQSRQSESTIWAEHRIQLLPSLRITQQVDPIDELIVKEEKELENKHVALWIQTFIITTNC